MRSHTLLISPLQHVRVQLVDWPRLLGPNRRHAIVLDHARHARVVDSTRREQDSERVSGLHAKSLLPQVPRLALLALSYAQSNDEKTTTPTLCLNQVSTARGAVPPRDVTSYERDRILDSAIAWLRARVHSACVSSHEQVVAWESKGGFSREIEYFKSTTSRIWFVLFLVQSVFFVEFVQACQRSTQRENQQRWEFVITRKVLHSKRNRLACLPE